MSRTPIPLPTGSTLPEAAALPGIPEALRFEIAEGRFLVRLARTEQEVEAAQRLRFQVFNIELGEGLEANRELGLDRDPFDAQCHHLLLIDTKDRVVVGTYRLQSAAMARGGIGFYCDGEYVLSRLGEDVLSDSVELGRACISTEHRLGPALYCLWRGLARYLVESGARYLFGCCSLTSRDQRDGLIADEWLADRGHFHPELRIPARDTHRCQGEPPTEAELAAFKLPKLFGSYVRFESLVVSEPAIDREFGTVDFLVMFDLAQLGPRVRALFFEF